MKWLETFNIHPRPSENSNFTHEIKAKARRKKPNPTVHTGGGCSGGAGDLSRKAGALDSLRALFDFVLVTTTVRCYDLTSSCLDMYCKKQNKDTKPLKLDSCLNLDSRH